MSRIPRREFLGFLGGAALTACVKNSGRDAPPPPKAAAGTVSAGQTATPAPAPAPTPRPTASATRPPNIVLVISDDQGYGDVGSYGCRDIPTPHLDSLAKNGARCTDAYVSCPLCSPSRAGLITGRYQQRFGHEFNTGKPNRQMSQPIGLPLDQKTIADVLHGAGYATGLVGKWHLGMQPAYHPLNRGFDEFFGFLHGGHAYLRNNPRGPNPIMRGRQPLKEREYLTDAFSREAASFVQQRKNKPFFLCLSYNAPHKPMEATERYLQRFAGIADPHRRTYAAMVSAVDDGVGRVLGALRETGVEQDTLVVFLSDNGGATLANGSQNGALRGHKGELYEGGIRVPLLAQWKGHIPAGTVHREPVSALDLLPTAAAAAGAKLPGAGLDGVNLVPRLSGKGDAPTRSLYWRLGRRRAVRNGRYKLLQKPGRPPELYDLTSDLSERTNLAGQHPQKVASLTADLDGWNATLKPALWQPPRPTGGKKRKRRRRKNW